MCFCLVAPVLCACLRIRISPWLQSYLYVKLRRDQYQVRLTSTSPCQRVSKGGPRKFYGRVHDDAFPPGPGGAAAPSPTSTPMQLMFENILSHFTAPSNAQHAPRCKIIKDDAGLSKPLELCCCIFQISNTHRDFHITKKNDENPLFPPNHPFDCDYDGIRRRVGGRRQRVPEQHKRQGKTVTFVCRNVTKKQDSNKPRMLVTLSHQARL